MDIVFNKVRVILHELYSFHYDQIEPQTKLVNELGVDSREFFQLLLEFEETFEIEIVFEDALKIITIQDAVDYIKQQLRESGKI